MTRLLHQLLAVFDNDVDKVALLSTKYIRIVVKYASGVRSPAARAN